jgi:hydroxymethylpyrimidine/phosphomethylpyrimidine kinase
MPSNDNNPPVVLVIAGNDPSGGAGLAADIQTLSQLGCHPAPVVTALTVQDTRNAYEVRVQEPALVAAQARAVLADMDVAAIKLGLLGSAGVARAVAGVLAGHANIPLVLDPVLVAAGGARLAEEELAREFFRELLPETTVATPNADESRVLAPGAADIATRAERLLDTGCRYVLIKGGDEDTPDVVNTLFGGDGSVKHYTWPRLPGSFHGSGCTLASAIAAGLAHGRSATEAVEQGQDYTWTALNAAWRPGRGQDVPRRMS